MGLVKNKIVKLFFEFHFCVICIIFLGLTSCGKRTAKQSKENEKFTPVEYIALTNINLDVIQTSKHKELIDKLNSLLCECPECSPGISLAQCISTNNFCSYSIVESQKLIKKYQKKY